MSDESLTAEELEALAGQDQPPATPAGAAFRNIREALHGLADVEDGAGEPMPADVAARLDAAVRAQVAGGSGPMGTPALLPAESARRRRLRRGGPSGGVPRWVPAAAAVVVVLAAGGGLTGVLVSGGGGGPKSSTSAASAPNAAALPSQLPVAEVASGFADDPALDSAVRQLVTGALPTAPAGVAAAVRSAASAAVSTSTAPPETAVPVTSAVPAPDQLKETTTQGTVGAAGTVPSAAGFPARAEPGGAAPMAGAPGGGAVTSQAPGLGPTFTGPGLGSCLQRLGQGARVRGVAVATYRGKRSLVVVFATANPHLVDVYVVGPGCDAAPPDGIRTIRLGVRVG